MEKIKQNDIKGRNHKHMEKKGLHVINVVIGQIWDKYMGCSLLSKRDYELNDGDCHFSFNEYKAKNK